MGVYFTQFDSVQLTSVTGLRILAIDPYLNKRSLSIGDIARSDKTKNTGAFYKERTINITVGLTRATRELAEQSLDDLMKILQGVEKTLIIPQGANVRKYTATLGTPRFNVQGGAYIELVLPFICSDMFGYDNDYTPILSATGRTLGLYQDAFTFGGSAPWQAVYVMILITAITGGTAKTLNIGNNDNGQQVAITRTWIAGDRVEIDGLAMTVKVNDVEVDYSGAIPEFAPGAGTLVVSDNFTTRTFNEQAFYYKRYI